MGKRQEREKITATKIAPAGQNEAGLSAMMAEVKKFAQRFFNGARGSHDWEHTSRVGRLCQRIGPAEEADMTVLMIAAYLHDIGRNHQDKSNGAVCHAEEGAKIAAPLIESLPRV